MKFIKKLTNHLKQNYIKYLLLLIRLIFKFIDFDF